MNLSTHKDILTPFLEGADQVVTIVQYKHWTGPVYFNPIRSFNHLLVSRMGRSRVTGRFVWEKK